MNSKIKLADKNICTGCGACYNACTKNAISMTEDQDGFLFPKINKEKCVNCGICSKVCFVINKKEKNYRPLNIYAAVAKNIQIAKTSSSGGIFSLLAEKVILYNGIVYGCAMDEEMKAEHIRISKLEEINLLKGSKYIQSNLGNIYNNVKMDLLSNKLVLFSGTPCQINGLNSFLQKKYENLLTVDLVCHGVPSYRFFKQYIKWFENKKNVRIKNYCFRDKTKTDLNCISRLDYYTKKGKEKTILSRYTPLFYFYYYYMTGDIYRNSCYHCPCLPNYRTSDITLGDYWGVEDIFPTINIENGMSVVIIHSNKGQYYFDKVETNKLKSTFLEATKHNKSILKPVQFSKKRKEIFKISNSENGEKLYLYCKKDIGLKIVINELKSLIPIKLKRKIIKLLKNNK